MSAAPEQVSEIALQQGEVLISVSVGDTVHQVVGDTTSGEGPGAQVHILVKPIAADLTANLVITTQSTGLPPGAPQLGCDLHGLGLLDLSL